MDKLSQATYNAVIVGQSFGDYVDIVKKHTAGLVKYAEVRAHDSLMSYYTQLNVKKARDAGIESFLWYGDIIGSSRPFCIVRAGKVFTIDQIKSWDKLIWKGKKPGSTLINRGGYNCRHSLHPCKPEWVENGEIEIQNWFNEIGKMPESLIKEVKKEEKRL